MYRMTQIGETSLTAIQRAHNAGEMHYARTNNGRWYVEQNGKFIFGFGTRKSFDDCQHFVAGIVSKK
jgi:hypothetical protein